MNDPARDRGDITHEEAGEICRRMSALRFRNGELTPQWDRIQSLPGYLPAFCAVFYREGEARDIAMELADLGLIRREHIKIDFQNPPYQASTGEKPYWLVSGRMRDMNLDALEAQPHPCDRQPVRPAFTFRPF